MTNPIAVLLFALTSQPAQEPGLLIAKDKELSTSVRLVETAGEVRFEFTGPEHVLPIVAIDVNRNGAVDLNLDFQISRGTDDSVCFQYLIREGASSTCKAPGEKATLVWSRNEQGTATTISFPKSVISGDGFGYGFAIKLWNKTGNYRTLLASGDYRFGGKISFVKEGPNFMGNKGSDFPEPIMHAIHRYEGCLHKSIDALAPLDPTVAPKLKAVPAGCAADRATAMRDGVDALIASGIEKGEATAEMLDALDRLDESVAHFAEIIEKGR